MVLPELSRTMAYKTRKTVNRLARKQPDLNCGARTTKRGINPRGGGGGTPMRNRRGCSSGILNLTPKGDQSGRDLSKFWPLKETT